MTTTIQISSELRDMLVARKLYPEETFEKVIFDLVEDAVELSEDTKMNITRYEEEIGKNRTNNFKSLEQIKKELEQ